MWRPSRLLAGMGVLVSMAAPATSAEQVRVTGEIIDTWCYFSGVMGGPEAVVGSAHHTCALWCAAGGIPVGMLADDGTVYMILKFAGDDQVAGGEAILDVQSSRIAVNGTLYPRDGINYLVVHDVVTNKGITNFSHDVFGVVPPFAIPDPE